MALTQKKEGEIVARTIHRHTERPISNALRATTTLKRKKIERRKGTVHSDSKRKRRYVSKKRE